MQFMLQMPFEIQSTKNLTKGKLYMKIKQNLIIYYVQELSNETDHGWSLHCVF